MLNLRKRLILVSAVVILALGLIFVWGKTDRTIEIANQVKNSSQSAQGKGVSPLSGLACQNYQRRPMAVVLAEDPAARPLSGLNQADLVFEMPVITGSITRLIAVYVCDSPGEIGSLRSARHDFVPLTMGLDAILVHWGGSHFALDKLGSGLMDNIDALKDPYNIFYRKNEISPPHNGFTSMERLVNGIKKLGYRLENEFEGYPHQPPYKNQAAESKVLAIGYSYPYNVKYQYEPKTNSYLRWRANQPEIDRSNSQQVRVKNVVIMRAFSRQIEGPDYNDLDIEGEGLCRVYQNGLEIPCAWRKNAQDPKSKLYFLDEDNQEIAFLPGSIWIEIVEPDQEVNWQ